MMRALKAAFFLRFPIRGLGDVPLNLIGVASLGLLGLGNHGFWFAGVGLETLYLASLASNPRFQRWASAQAHLQQNVDVEAKRRALVAQLPDADRTAMQRLSQKCDRIESLWRAQEDVILQTNDHTLRDLQWLYLKLLIARQHLLASENEADGTRLQADLVTLRRELGDPALSAAARESKTATLALLKRRAENVARRRQTLEEIASDLARIEAQIALVLENTTLEGKPQAISSDLELASQLLDGTLFGSSAEEVAALDSAYSQPATKVAE
jgi:hypothetical protein